MNINFKKRLEMESFRETVENVVEALLQCIEARMNARKAYGVRSGKITLTCTQLAQYLPNHYLTLNGTPKPNICVILMFIMEKLGISGQKRSNKRIYIFNIDQIPKTKEEILKKVFGK